MRAQEKITNWIKTKSYLPKIITGLAGIGYSIQTWIYSHNQESFLDEGFYLLKGYLFATGRYRPFQEFGTWTNKMPLSFLVPGYIQKIFGPGLNTGRTYAFILSLLILVGVYLVGKRLRGDWGGALTALMITLNPANLKIYSMVLSQVLIVFLLVFTLLLILGRDRPLWQILIGSFLAGIIPVTRINLLPVYPLVLAYIFWEHGTKKGIYGLIVSLLPFLGAQILYWPNILQLWVKWVPTSLTPLLDPWRLNFGAAIELHAQQRSLISRFLAAIEGVRFHFPALVGVFSVLFFWPRKWRERSEFRSAVFLLCLFFVLLVTHAGASIFQTYNVFAFSVYLAFFDILGILIVVLTWRDWDYVQPYWKRFLILISIALIVLGLAYTVSAEETNFGGTIKALLLRNALSLEDGRIVLASWRWWEVFESRFGWEFATSLKVLGISIYLLLFVLLITLGTLIILRWNKKRDISPELIHIMPAVLIVFLCLGILFSPLDILGGGRHNYDCQIGVINTYDNAVDLVSSYVEPDDSIFWIGSDTQPVLLGLVEEKDVQLFPQQLNAQYSFRIGGKMEQLSKRGFWNPQLAQEWINTSDILLFEEQAISGWFSPFLPQVDIKEFEFVGETNVIGCSEEQRLSIYRRSQ